MSNTITLPDHISFEELAAKWCDEFVSEGLFGLEGMGIVFSKLKRKRKIEIGNSFVVYVGEYSVGDVFGYIAADYYPSDRKILIRDEEKFQPILDYIKERSHG